MSKHHHRDRCRERYDHRQRCDERMFLAYPMGPMPGSEPFQAPGFFSSSDNVEAMQGGSCFMTPQGPVCPGSGGCLQTPQGMVCPIPGSEGCQMGPQGMVCPFTGRR